MPSQPLAWPPGSGTAARGTATGANVEDYVRWRGDLAFAERPFNDVDDLILTTLSYVDLRGLVPAPGDGETTIAVAAGLLAPGAASDGAVYVAFHGTDNTIMG